MPLPHLLTAAEVAKIRNRTPQALCMERQRGEGPPYIQDGGRVMYAEDELEKWLASRRVDPSLAPKPRRRPVAKKATAKAPDDSRSARAP